MPYALLSDVQSRMPQFTLTAVTRPNLDTAQVFLDDSHAQLDAVLTNLLYVVPVPGTGTGLLALPQVREAVCDRTIARILYARGAAVGTDAAMQSADACQARYDKFLADLADPDSPVELVDAETFSGESTKEYISALDGLVYDENGDKIEPRISMGSSVSSMKDW